MIEAARKPHPGTGEPRPPRAPVRSTWDNSGKRDARKARFPAAPAGRGPVLEWYQPRVRDSFVTGAMMAFLIAMFLCLKDWGIGWMATWWLWLFVVAPVVWMAATTWEYGISAGADWLAVKKGYVDTYNLTEVKLEGAGAGLSWRLTLKDRKGTEFFLDLANLQSNRDLWDLVFNGIVYSVGRGAKTNPKAIDKLKLR